MPNQFSSRATRASSRLLDRMGDTVVYYSYNTDNSVKTGYPKTIKSLIFNELIQTEFADYGNTTKLENNTKTIIINKSDVPTPILGDSIIIGSDEYTVMAVTEQGAALFALSVELIKKKRIGKGKITR